MPSKSTDEDKEQQKKEPLLTDLTSSKEFQEAYKNMPDNLKEKIQKRKVLLRLPVDLVKQLDAILPPWHTRSSAIAQLIDEHVKYVEWQKGNKNDKKPA